MTTPHEKTPHSTGPHFGRRGGTVVATSPAGGRGRGAVHGPRGKVLLVSEELVLREQMVLSVSIVVVHPLSAAMEHLFKSEISVNLTRIFHVDSVMEQDLRSELHSDTRLEEGTTLTLEPRWPGSMVVVAKMSNPRRNRMEEEMVLTKGMF